MTEEKSGRWEEYKKGKEQKKYEEKRMRMRKRKKWKEQHGEKDRQKMKKTGVVQEELGNMLIREKEQWVVRVDESNKQRRGMRKELQVKQGRHREE